MSKPPLPEAAMAMLRKPNPAVITTLRRDGQPVSAATWYLWDDGRVLPAGNAAAAVSRGVGRVRGAG
jgi:pyridoxamine 5'-phosphate oxidase-like protein